MDKKKRLLKNILITDATKGLAREFCKLYAANGYGLILVDRRKESLRQLADSLTRDHGVRSECIALDPRAADAAARIVSQVQEAHLRVDEMLSRYGFRVYGPFSEKDLSQEIGRICAEYRSDTPWTCEPVRPAASAAVMALNTNGRLI